MEPRNWQARTSGRLGLVSVVVLSECPFFASYLIIYYFVALVSLGKIGYIFIKGSFKNVVEQRDTMDSPPISAGNCWDVCVVRCVR